MTPTLLLQSEVAEEVHVADGDYGWITSPEEEEAAFDETRFELPPRVPGRVKVALGGFFLFARGWGKAALGNHATFLTRPPARRHVWRVVQFLFSQATHSDEGRERDRVYLTIIRHSL